jgi:hypothetical protein
LSSLHETLGEAFYLSLLNQSGLGEIALHVLPDDATRDFPFSKLGVLFATLEKMAGETVQGGVLQRSGRAWFLSLQRRSSPSLGIFNARVLTLPKRLKVKSCGEILAEYFSRYMGIGFLVESSPQMLQWGFEFPYPEHRSLIGKSLANLWLGFWSELLYTLSGGKPYLLRLTAPLEEGQPIWMIYIPFLPFEG